MIIDWKKVISTLTGTLDWEEMEPPASDASNAAYWKNGSDRAVRFDTDKDDFELWFIAEDGASRLLWRGNGELLALDPQLGHYVTLDEGNKDAVVRFDPHNNLAPYKAVYQIHGQMTSYRYQTAQAAQAELTRAGYSVTLKDRELVDDAPSFS